MAAANGSRAHTPVNSTLLDVIAAIRASDLPQRRRQELVSAVRTVTKAFKRPIGDIPVDLRLLANRLAEVTPVSIGLSAGRWANVKSLFRAALALVRTVSPGRQLTSLSPDWLRLWEQLPNRTSKTRLSRFARFASAAGVHPESVTADTFAKFHEFLDASLLKDPDRVYCATIDGWKVARKGVGDWPDLEVVRPNRHREWALPWSAFPNTLERDVLAWLERIAGSDLLAEGPARPVRPITARSHLSQLRRFASAVVLSGRTPESLISLADLVAIDAFVAGLTFLLQKRANKANGVRNTAGLLKAIARHHVDVEQRHLAEMSRIIRRIGRAPRGMTPKNRERLRPLDDPQNVHALLGLPAKLMELARREHRPYKAALLAQTSIAVEILEMTLMRMRNLVGLDIEKHFKRMGRSGAIHIVIEGDETKNREPLEYPLHPRSASLIEIYLVQYRSTLRGGQGSALFPGEDGRPKHANTLAEQIKQAVWRHTGLAWNVHLFRHAGAKLHLDENPGSYGVPSRVLGHRSQATTTTFYSGQELTAAVRHFDHTILKLRDRFAIPAEKR